MFPNLGVHARFTEMKNHQTVNDTFLSFPNTPETTAIIHTHTAPK